MKPSFELLEARIVPSRRVYLATADEYYPEQWALPAINAPEGWAVVPGNASVVAVVDTGVDYTHPDMIDLVWTNPGEIAGNSIDDDDNGYIDDIHGWDFSDDFVDNAPGDPNSNDTNGHGTMVAGIIASNHNSIGIAGINDSVKIMPLKIFNVHGISLVKWANKALRYAAANGASIINCSWGTPEWKQSMRDAVVYAKNRDVLVVAAAGNTPNSDFYPASFQVNNVLSVGAIDQYGAKPIWSNYGEIYAPGVDVISTFSDGEVVGYATSSGTSFSAPHVAAVASLVYNGDFALVIDKLIEHSDYLRLDMFDFLSHWND